MMMKDINVRILIADDDIDDRILLDDAFSETGLNHSLTFVEDGEKLLRFLKREGEYKEFEMDPLPDLIILDLNMPKVDGRTALIQIKNDSDLNHIPVVVMTTSKAEEDIRKTYELGVNSFISKPILFEDLVRIVEVIRIYWLEVVALPSIRQ